jgi:hypothetical protein
MGDRNYSWKAIAVVAVVFALGIALGGFGEHLWNAHVQASQRKPSVVQRLKQELQLSTDEAKQFDMIISDERSKFHAIDQQEHVEWDPKFHALAAQEHEEWDPKWDEVREQGRARIRSILTPEQRDKFNAFVNKLDEQRRKEQGQQH